MKYAGIILIGLIALGYSMLGVLFYILISNWWTKVNENIKFGLYKLFENYIEAFSGYEYDIRCIPEEVIESLILDVIESIKTKEWNAKENVDCCEKRNTK